MPITLVNPLDETPRIVSNPAPRLNNLAGKTIGLLDISKPGGSVFLSSSAAALIAWRRLIIATLYHPRRACLRRHFPPGSYAGATP